MNSFGSPAVIFLHGPNYGMFSLTTGGVGHKLSELNKRPRWENTETAVDGE